MKFYNEFNFKSIVLLFIIKSVIYCKKFDDNLIETKKAETTVWLTVSSLAGLDKKLDQPFERQLELNWREAATDGTDTWIGLFSEEPKVDKLLENEKNYSIEWIPINGQKSGSHRTSIQYPYKKFSAKNIHLKCLKYWIGLIETNRVIAKNCLKINPFWMENNLQELGDMTLMELMIPGTHNSASSDRFSLKEDTLYKKYSVCQDESVFNQLVYGIRFLDIRVAYDKQEGQNYKLWIVHGPIIMKHTLNSVLAQVKRFLDLAPKEVVVIDFHRFENGFNKDEESPQLIRRHHRKVMALINKNLNQYIVPKRMALNNTTLNEFIANNKRLVIGYDSDHYLFHPIAKHLWPNTDYVEELVEYFNETICEYFPEQLTSAMAHLTAERFSIIIDRYNGLRTMAQTLNRVITDAFDTGNRGWANCANVVSTDYFLGNNLIEISIKTNIIRAKNSLK